MTAVQVLIPDKLVPVLAPPPGTYDFRGAYGGRGSAKTRTFAKMTAVFGLMLAAQGLDGLIVCGREHIKSLDESSYAEVKAAILSEPWLAANYEIGETYIRTRCGLIAYAFVGLRYNLDSIKSKAKIRLLWVDEAERVSENAWVKVIPTVREDGAEIWVTWNPESERSATHKRFREGAPERSIFVEMNWRDNPWFPDRLNRTRLEDKEKRPDQYEHIWEGGMVTAMVGAYYAADLLKAREEKRICRLPRDPLLPIRAIWDIGGTGLKADARAIWIQQIVDQEIHWLDYRETRSMPLSADVEWLRENKYGSAVCILPHDGKQGDKVIDTSYEKALKDAGFEVEVIENQGKGAAMKRVEAARRLFPKMLFDEEKTKEGLAALAHYHEKRSEDIRNMSYGPDHDWSSHGADSFGLGAVAYERPKKRNDKTRKIEYPKLGIH